MNDFIQQNQGALMVFFIVLAAAFFAAAVLLAIMLRNTEKKADQRLKQARADITDMTILFQTMRDIIGQQKALAKDFNEEIEHKMEQVKHILNQGMEKNKQLYDKQQRIVVELEEAQARIDGIYRQIADAQRTPGGTERRPAVASAQAPAMPVGERLAPAVPRRPAAPAPPPSPTSTPVASAPPARIPVADPRDVPTGVRSPIIRTGRPAPDSASRALAGRLTPEEEARLSDTGVTKAPYTSWVAENLPAAPETPAKAKPARPAEPDPAAHGPSNGDAAREAFRALLNMPAPQGQPDRRPLEAAGEMGARMAMAPDAPEGPDEGHMTASLQQRVLEYSEAGMTVAQVSRELGIGKGEVRLMLSLAKQKTPQRG